MLERMNNRISPEARAVLSFWLGAWPLDNSTMLGAQPQWFRKDAAFDVALRQRFGHTISAALTGRYDAWARNAEGRLALLVVLDQFTRNAFRGHPDSFGGDAKALTLALEGIALGHDQDVPPMARIFFYLPLEHAEDAAVQARSVALFQALRDTPDAEPKPWFDAVLDYAHRHAEVIGRFGRFPHRNPVLGRISTPEEQHHLAQPGAGF